MGLLGFAVTCFDVLAWPLISLGYPLCASIRAIEVKSNLDMQKLITYWILFSLISLFELGFSKPIEWLPFWPYIKLMVISYLVLPRFDGAYHVYAYLVRPYCYVNPQVVINKFNKLKELSHKGENFLAMAEKYVEENGSEALEKLIASKSKGTKLSSDVEEIKAVANTEKKEVAIEPKCNDRIIVRNDIKAVEQTEKNAAAAAKSNGKDPIVVQKEFKAVEKTEKNAVAAAPKVKNGEQNLADAEKKTDATVEIKETTATSVAGGESKLPDVSTSKNVQKEWSCAVCQMTVNCEKNFNLHLQGRKHRAKCEELKASKQTDKNKGLLSSTANKSDQADQDPGTLKWSQVNSCKPGNPDNAGTQMQQSNFWCSICNNMCTGEMDMACHQPKCNDPIVVQKDIKAVEQTEKNAAAAAKKVIKAVEQTEKNAAAAAPKSKGKDPIVVPKDIKAVEQTEKNAATVAPKVKNGDQNLADAEKKTDVTVEIKETAGTSAAGGENKLPEVSTSKNVQKEWTCAACQLTVNCEKTLNSHLHGRKHRAKCEALKASKQTDKNNGLLSSATNKSDQDPGSHKWSQVNNAGTQMQQSKLWCRICNVWCPGEIEMACHLNGWTHFTRIQEVFGCAGGGQGWVCGY
ncbi:uncharacterized protein LOC132294218 isoform X3 [Cornus florida]|uniref:uncharacterized protein LOC132294218 isoform X3 n=1 Tax=Cornus florida TaxID=4283 RepID=UPI00289CC34A|nr:uncharacterized protein LOC132294218 isoform X3 [Cornus florida]